jgi:hypothetical protein
MLNCSGSSSAALSAIEQRNERRVRGVQRWAQAHRVRDFHDGRVAAAAGIASGVDDGNQADFKVRHDYTAAGSAAADHPRTRSTELVSGLVRADIRASFHADHHMRSAAPLWEDVRAWE